jgi:hypothetical protein
MSYFENNIYIQTAYQGVRNKDILNVNTSSDICTFIAPDYTISGASKLPCNADFSAITTGTSYVYSISTDTTKDITFQFTGNTDSFTGTNATFKYEIYKFDNNLGYYHYPPQYRSSEISWSTFSGTSALTESIPLSNLSIDGDYIIKGFFIHDVCTEFANRLGLRYDTSTFVSGEIFGLYEPNKDFYMVIFREADVPQLTINTGAGSLTPTIRQKVIIPKNDETQFLLPDDASPDFIVTLNGLVLSDTYDYSTTQYSGGSNSIGITLSGSIKDTDIITFIYSSKNSTVLKTDTIDVTSIPSGPTNGEGSNSVYYNTTESKYEIYTTITPLTTNDIIVMINGVTLANGVDYYQSITNSKRIILTGTLLIGDIITIGYIPNIDYVDSINTPTPNINWTIANPPQLVNGEFILEFASDSLMTTQVSSAQTEYVIGQVTYNASGLISGSVGTNLYYRVTNIKNYETLCGDLIQSIAYSEIIPITIATNSINSY